MDKVLRYFLGSSSPQGYVSRPDQLGEPGSWRCWVVQGGAAASRSAVIARARRAMEGRDALVEELVCSGDPSTLDGAIFPGCRVSIADGDPPHAIQPRHPGAYEEMVSLWDCLDRRALWDAREEIIRLEREGERLERDAGGYLYAAGALTGELASMGAAATDRGKLLAYARRLAAREFPRPAGKKGGEKVRLLSAVTPEGQLLLRDTVAAAAPRAIAIEDSWGAVANALLEALRDLALESGLEVVTCRCPLFPFTKLDHLLLPQLGLGFLTLNRGNARELAGLTQRAIHATRFCDGARLRQRKGRAAFLRRAAAGMLDQAAEVLGQQREVRRQLDRLLLSATDQDAVEAVASRVAKEMAAG